MENNNFKLKKEKIKAIRLVRGFYSDLRIKLNLTEFEKHRLYRWIIENYHGIFEEPAYILVHTNEPGWDVQDRRIRAVIDQVNEGR